jgi:predicted  nucleic acid-binding Zn-ribbon protein
MSLNHEHGTSSPSLAALGSQVPPAPTQEAAALRQAHQELLECRSRLAQREETLRALLHRLEELERPYWEWRSELHDALESTRQQVKALETELAAVYSTRTFRYTAAARRAYGRLRGRSS